VTDARRDARRFAGGVSLILIFFASAGITVSYLHSRSAPAPQSPQTALAAVALPHVDAYASTTLSAHAAYVFDLTSSTTLYTKNADIVWPLASLTKVLLTLVVSEVLAPDMHITIPYDTALTEGGHYLRHGDVWRVRDILDFTLVASSNEGADILAGAADEPLHEKYPQSPAHDTTLWRMNDLAHDLGLHETHFLNVNGLDESATQAGAYGSARDMARLFAYAASQKLDIFSATTQPTRALTSQNGVKTTAVNTDKALDLIPGLLMGKTGYTDLAGGNLAVVFSASARDARPQHTVVAVVLGSTQDGRFEDMKKLIAATQKALAQ